MCMCDDYTVPMPVSGGCPAFVAMMGAAFAPIAVAGGVSILACREGERVDETEGMTVQSCIYMVLQTTVLHSKMRAVINHSGNISTSVIWQINTIIHTRFSDLRKA